MFKKVCKFLVEKDVEFRVGTAGGGSQARQPYLEQYDFVTHELTNMDYIHEYGLYIGNHPELNQDDIINLCKELNEL